MIIRFQFPQGFQRNPCGNWNLMIMRGSSHSFRYRWEDLASSERLIYGDFFNPQANPRAYEEIDDIARLNKVMTDYLDYYNGTAEKPMHLVLFTDAIEHVARISRIIRQPRGHALLLGMGGSGKQSLTKLASAMADYELFQIEISSTYGVNEFRDDLKKVILDTGLEEKKIVFLFSDTQIVDQSFLEDINSIECVRSVMTG